MRKTLYTVLLAFCLMFPGCRPSVPDDQITAGPFAAEETAMKERLLSALTFHVSFDSNADADIGGGDHQLYSGGFNNKGEPSSGTVPGPGDPPLKVEALKGKFGGALEFTKANTHPVFYKLTGNMGYAQQNFNGAASFWMSVDTNDIPEKYCDPLQICDKYYAGDCIWVDITKNDIPSDFRLGFFGDHSIWDKDNREGSAEAFFWRVAKVSEPPFAKGKWTHVAITWENVNTDGTGRAWLYLDGMLAGRSGPILEPMSWNEEHATLRLGTGSYVGLFDDIALFNRTLTADEIALLYGLKAGVKDLRNR